MTTPDLKNLRDQLGSGNQPSYNEENSRNEERETVIASFVSALIIALGILTISNFYGFINVLAYPNSIKATPVHKIKEFSNRDGWINKSCIDGTEKLVRRYIIGKGRYYTCKVIDRYKYSHFAKGASGRLGMGINLFFFPLLAVFLIGRFSVTHSQNQNSETMWSCLGKAIATLFDEDLRAVVIGAIIANAVFLLYYHSAVMAVYSKLS